MTTGRTEFDESELKRFSQPAQYILTLARELGWKRRWINTKKMTVEVRSPDGHKTFNLSVSAVHGGNVNKAMMALFHYSDKEKFTELWAGAKDLRADPALASVVATLGTRLYVGSAVHAAMEDALVEKASKALIEKEVREDPEHVVVWNESPRIVRKQLGKQTLWVCQDHESPKTYGTTAERDAHLATHLDDSTTERLVAKSKPYLPAEEPDPAMKWVAMPPSANGVVWQRRVNQGVVEWMCDDHGSHPFITTNPMAKPGHTTQHNPKMREFQKAGAAATAAKHGVKSSGPWKMKSGQTRPNIIERVYNDGHRSYHCKFCSMTADTGAGVAQHQRFLHKDEQVTAVQDLNTTTREEPTVAPEPTQTQQRGAMQKLIDDSDTLAKVRALVRSGDVEELTEVRRQLAEEQRRNSDLERLLEEANERAQKVEDEFAAFTALLRERG